MDQIFTSQFWHDQWAVVNSAPRVVIPLVLLAGLIGWKWKGTNDDGEIRGLKAELKVADRALDFARQQYEAIVRQIDDLNDKVTLQDKVIAELRREPIAAPRVNELETSNTQIKNVLSNLSKSTATLGKALTVVYIQPRPLGRPEGSHIDDYVVEDHADHALATFKTQGEAIDWAKKNGFIAHMPRIRHLNDKKKVDHWRAV